MTNIFAIGNVLDPHITIRGKCRACKGGGRHESGTECDRCLGTGEDAARVRLSELITPLQGAEFVGTAEESHP